MVVGDFAAIDDLLHMDRKLFLHGKRLAHIRHQPRKGCRHILRQKAAVRAGVGDESFFVKALGIIQGLLCRKSQQTVCIPLQCSKVIELRRAFGFFLAFHLLHRDTLLLSAFGKQQFGIRFLGKPFAGCGAAVRKGQGNRVEFLRHKGGNGGFPNHRHGKYWGHNTPHRQRLTVQARKKPEKFYTVDLELTSGCTASSTRFAQKADAELLLSKCRKEGRVTVQKMERKEKSESPPQLYDLTALQRDANRLLGFTAQQTLDYAQSLYEKRLITYPRTDSRFLTEDMAASLPGLVTDTGRAFAVEEPIPIHVQQVINGGKVTDHHALLPTKSMANADLAALPAGERNVLRLIAARLLCAVGEPHCYAETTLTTICAGEEFSAKGKLVLSDGWRAMERKMLGELLGKQKEPAVLPDVQEQSQCSVAGVELKEGQTSPPKHFTEDLLLHAMEIASADSMPEGVERQGIGTPATRAATIEKLVQKGFLERKGTKKTKVLLPTDKGKALITVMPEEIQSADMTADWEAKLLQIERSEMEPSEFMTEINTMITELVKNTEMKKGVNALMKNKIIGVCPNCGANVVEREKGWFCENRECRFVLWKDNAFFKRLGKRLDSHVADKLLRDGRVRLKDCKSAKGKTYNATVLLSCEADGRSRFSLEFEGGC